MADSLKALTKPMQAELRNGERLLGGSKAGGKNAALAAGIGGIAGAAIQARAGKHEGVAEQIPQDRLFWVAVTDQRLVFLSPSAMSGAPKKVKGDLAIDKITTVAIKPQKLNKRFTLVFDDGSAAILDVPKMGSPDSLRSSLEQALPGKVSDEA